MTQCHGGTRIKKFDLSPMLPYIYFDILIQSYSYFSVESARLKSLYKGLHSLIGFLESTNHIKATQENISVLFNFSIFRECHA